MAAFTRPSPEELTRFLSTYGIDNYDTFRAIEGGSVNSNFSVAVGGHAWFLRLYEEQDEVGAERELAMVAELGRLGVPTPAALSGARELAGRPAALFPWVEGQMRCQRSVTPDDVRALGRALGQVHVAGKGIALPQGRFHADALQARLAPLDGDAYAAYPIERLRRELRAIANARDTSLPQGLVHGDLFRDNVLWEGSRLAALLDFESTFEGALVYDLAVCVLSWCYGDTFAPDLMRALVSGYESVRPLVDRERDAFFAEARFAALRFTITRITDYALRPGVAGGEVRVMKDWKRFLQRLDAIDRMGEGGFAGLL